MSRRFSRIPQRRHRRRKVGPDDEGVAAAPHLFDDPIASPELALVDADLAAQLRADLAPGDSFRPRDAARAEAPILVFDAVVRDLTVPQPDVPVDEAPRVQDEAVPVDERVPDEPLAQPVLAALPPPEEQSFEFPEYVVVGDDDVVRDQPLESDLAEAEPAVLSEDVLQDDEPLSVCGPEELALPVEGGVELREHLVEGVEGTGDSVDELPDYVVRPELEPAPALPEYVVTPAEVPAFEDDVADTVLGDVIVPEAVEASTDPAASSSDYPVLPDLEQRSDALDETDAALRRIREQLVAPDGKPASRPRRRLAIVSGIGAAAALAAVAVDVELGLLHAPGWLTF
jgi:hypothetical protein